MVLDLIAEHINKPKEKSEAQVWLLTFKEKAQLMAVFGLWYIQEAWDKLHKKIFGKKDEAKDNTP